MRRALLGLLFVSATAFAQVDAGQVTKGTLPGARLPAPTATTLGGVKGTGGNLTCGAGSMQNGFASDGSVFCIPTTTIDPRKDYGVTCTGTTDDTTAMQNAVNAACNIGNGRGGALVLPNGCSVKLTSTLVVNKCQGITITGPQSQGQTTATGPGVTSFLWYGPLGGAVFEVNQTRDSYFGHFAIDAEASNHSAAGANTGLLVDEIGTVTGITTNNHYDNISVYNQTANPNFIGVDLCPTAPGNCESQNFDRLFVTCGGGTAGVSDHGTGIKYEVVHGAEPYFEYLHWFQSSTCSLAIDLEGGFDIDISGGLQNANYTDLLLNGGALIGYKYFRSEGGIAQIVFGNSSTSSMKDVNIEHNSFSGLTNSTTTISYPFSSTGGTVSLKYNAWDPNATITPFGPTGAGVFTGVLDSQDNTYPNNSLCIFAAFISSGNGVSSLNDGPVNGTCDYGKMHLGRSRGALQLDPTAFGNLPACASGTEGMLKAISDSTVNLWGATILGGGANHVYGWCNGTNWMVFGGNGAAGGSFSTLSLGTNPATTGILNMPNNGKIQYRNPANSNDIQALFIDASSALILGSGGGAGVAPASVQLYAGAASGGLVSLTLGLNAHEVTTDSGSAFCVSTDTCWWRSAAGVYALGSGTVGSSTGKAKAAAYMSGGTTFTTNAGCSETSLTGGASAGTFLVGSTSCTTIITLGNTATATTGWSCWAHDLTTSADYYNPHISPASTTTVTLVTGTVVSGDKIEFGCLGY